MYLVAQNTVDEFSLMPNFWEGRPVMSNNSLDFVGDMDQSQAFIFLLRLGYL